MKMFHRVFDAVSNDKHELKSNYDRNYFLKYFYELLPNGYYNLIVYSMKSIV